MRRRRPRSARAFLHALGALVVLATVGGNAVAAAEANDKLAPAWLEPELNAFWGELFAARGREFHPPRVDLYDGDIQTPCGDVSGTAFPLYCRADNTVYVVSYFRQTVVDSIGEPYWVVQMARLWAVVAFWELGLTGDVPPDFPLARSIADPSLHFCLGGAFLGHAIAEDLLERDAVEAMFAETAQAPLASPEGLERQSLGFDRGIAACDLDFGSATPMP